MVPGRSTESTRNQGGSKRRFPRGFVQTLKILVEMIKKTYGYGVRRGFEGNSWNVYRCSSYEEIVKSKEFDIFVNRES